MLRAWIVVAFAYGLCHGQAAPPAAPAAPAQPAQPRNSPMMIDELKQRLTNQEASIKARMTRISDELAAMDTTTQKADDWAKEWAGSYYTGDGLGENVSISLAPKAGIAFLNYGCMGLYGGDEGDIAEVLPDGLKLKLVFGSANGSFLSERVYFVKWGELRFLVPDWQMMDFVNRYNEGGYSRSGMFGIARKTPKGEHPSRIGLVATVGKPELPAPYDKLLQEKPIALKVIKVSAPTKRDVTTGVTAHSVAIEFEGGTGAGVYVGMEFNYPQDLVANSGSVRITRADEKTCTGELTSFLGEKDNPLLPSVGDTVKTGSTNEETLRRLQTPPAVK
ncbi:MAG: hypothetical protein GC200_05940 [Tepidisphaera sp.]|nr:hypothetical protein [Tepidisphaera sp.]